MSSLSRKVARFHRDRERYRGPPIPKPGVTNNPDKGQKDGSCNRTACQRPLKDELEHQFMDGIFTGGPRLYYCAGCAREFDRWDFRSGDRVRIKREPKVCEAA